MLADRKIMGSFIHREEEMRRDEISVMICIMIMITIIILSIKHEDGTLTTVLTKRLCFQSRGSQERRKI